MIESKLGDKGLTNNCSLSDLPLTFFFLFDFSITCTVMIIKFCHSCDHAKLSDMCLVQFWLEVQFCSTQVNERDHEILIVN